MNNATKNIQEATFKKLYRQRWPIFILGTLAHTVGLFHRAALAPMADRIMADFGITAVAFGSLGAAYFYIYAAMQLPSGTLTDTLGPRKTVTAGLLTASLGSIVMGLAPTFGAVYAGRLIVSFGVSLAWISCVKLIMEWFSTKESGTLLGISGSLTNLGQIIASTPLALLIVWIGWQMSLIAMGVATLALAAIYWAVVRDSPAKVGLPPVDAANRDNVLQGSVLSDFTNSKISQRFKIVFGNKHLWPPFLVAMGAYGAYSTLFNNWAVLYIMQVYTVSRSSAANFMLVATIGLMIGLAAIGFLSDRVFQKRRLPMILFNGISLTTLLAITIWNGGQPPINALYPLFFILGIGSAPIVLTFACVRDLVQPSVRGIATGLVNAGGFIGTAIVQPLFGYMLDLGWKGAMSGGVRFYPPLAFQQGLWLCCTLSLIGLIGALLIKETNCRPIYTAND